MISSKLPERLRDRAEAALTDPQLSSTRSSIAILEAMLEDKYEQLSEESPGAAWQDALKRFYEIRKVLRIHFSKKDEARIDGEEQLGKLEELFKAGIGQDRIERDIRELFQEQSRLREVEVRRQKEMESLIDPVTMVAYLQKVREIILYVARTDEDRAYVRDSLNSLLPLDIGRVIEGGQQEAQAPVPDRALPQGQKAMGSKRK